MIRGTRRAAVSACWLAGALAAVLLVAGVGWAFADRSAEPSLPAVALLLSGTLLGLGAVNALIGLERRPDGLAVPAGRSLPTIGWGTPVLLVGLADLVGGLWASLPVAVLGGGLTVLGALGTAFWPRSRDGLDREVVAAARRIARLASAGQREGRPGTVALEHLGRGAIRVVVVGATRFGDVVLHDQDRAQLAARLAGVEVGRIDERALAASVSTDPSEWKRMGSRTA